MDKKLVSPKNNEYIFNENSKLGSGAFGDVFLGFDASHNQEVAIKRVNPSVLDNYGEEYIRFVGSGANIVQECGQNEHIVAIYDCFRTSCLNIIMELCDEGTLKDALAKTIYGYFTEEQALGHLKEIVEGLSALHRSGRMHRNLKLENVFLKNGKCKIGDFGFTTKQETSHLFVGTLEYMAPEIVEGRIYKKSVDIWALGMLLHRMLFGDSAEMQAKRQAVVIPNSLNISKETVELLRKMLTVDPTQRITVEEIQSHFKVRQYCQTFKMSDDFKNALTEGLQQELQSNISSKLEKYYQDCYYFLKLFSNVRSYIKENQENAEEDLYAFCYYLLKFVYHQSKFLSVNLEKKTCPQQLLTIPEGNCWDLFVKSEAYETLKMKVKTFVKTSREIFNQYREVEFESYLVKANKDPVKCEILYPKDLEIEANLTFREKLWKVAAFFQKQDPNSQLAGHFKSAMKLIAENKKFGNDCGADYPSLSV